MTDVAGEVRIEQEGAPLDERLSNRAVAEVIGVSERHGCGASTMPVGSMFMTIRTAPGGRVWKTTS